MGKGIKKPEDIAVTGNPEHGKNGPPGVTC